MPDSQADISDTSEVASQNNHPDFEWIRSQTIDALNLTVEEYRHRKTGAQHFHLAADNPENVFLVALRTVPMDSTGVAHILEHTVLCGSERYPVRDPFFMMIRRSLNTFMNAFTSSDWTAYPFASQNRKDFFNLLDVYLDAVFFSRLDELDFVQEGHRVEFNTPDDPDTELVYKGVVFNEMKGSMSSTTNTLWQLLTEQLFPTTTYHYNSGGDPEVITDLNYKDLIQFYRTHYHPSNAVLMTYGDIPAAELQEVFEKRALSRFDRLDTRIEVSDEQRYDKPHVVSESYALDEAEATGDKTHIVMGWLLGKSTDSMALMRAHLLSGVLLDNSASPLRHALETTELGTAPSPLCGLEDSNREMSFMCGVEGSCPEHAEAVENLILNVLRDVAENGIAPEMLEAVLHQLELNQREIKGDGYPYGLQLILEGLSSAIHRGDPVSLLDLDPVLEKLHRDIADPDFIKQLTRELLLDNMHRVRLTMKPDTGLSQKRASDEKGRLQQIKDHLGDDAKQKIIKRADALVKRQAQEDDPEILPKVGLEDVPKDLRVPQAVAGRVAEASATIYAQGTNGLIYEQVIIDLPKLDEALLDVLPYYTSCLTEIGSGGRDYLATQVLKDSVTGGISCNTSFRGTTADVQDVSGHSILSGKALVRNKGSLSDLMSEILVSPGWGELTRIRDLIAQDRARAEQSVTGNGHFLAMLAASSGMNPAAALSHRLQGLAGIQALKSLDDGLEDHACLEQLIEMFTEIHRRIAVTSRQFLIISESECCDSAVESMTESWPQTEKNHESALFAPQSIRTHARQMWVTSTQVNFCAKSYPTVSPDHVDTAPLTVLGGFLRNGYLHRAIRERGGAYGGGAAHDMDIAAFRFFSYRDPRLTDTLDDFDRSIDWLLTTKHKWREVEEAILGVISSIDKPGSPSGEAKKAFHNALYGRTKEQRKQFRSRVLDVVLDDLLRVGEKYLKVDNASIAVITNASVRQEVGDLDLDVFQL